MLKLAAIVAVVFGAFVAGVLVAPAAKALAVELPERALQRRRDIVRMERPRRAHPSTTQRRYGPNGMLLHPTERE